MKRLAVILGALILLTGCQSLDEMKSQEQERERLHITTYTEQVMEAPSDVSKVLERSAQSLEYDNIWRSYHGYSLANRLGLNTESIMVHVNLEGGKNDEDILRNLENVLGEELQSFIDEVKSQEEEYYFAEKAIGDYGVACNKIGDVVALDILPSQSNYLDEAKRHQIEAFCGEELIVTGTTAGKEKSMVELSFPSYQVRNHTAELNNTTAYYQVFSNKENEIEKIRMVINQYEGGYKEGILEEDKLLPLRRMLQEMQVGTEEEMKLIGGINQVVNQEDNQQKGKTEHFEYTIRKSDAPIYYEKLITVEINF